MNSINFTHFDASAKGGSPLDLALDRLGAWLDAEHDTLGSLLAQAGRWRAMEALEELDQMHLAPETGDRALRNLLEDARTLLEVLLEALCAIPSNCRLETAWGLPGPAPFDAHLRWSGARLTDILSTLKRALAA